MGEDNRNQTRIREGARPSVRVLDGAMGTELQRRGYPTPAPLWSAAPLILEPESVVRIHADYLSRGANVLTANTFRTNLRTFEAAGRRLEDARAATHLAIDCARRAVARAAGGDRVLIAGSMAPVCDCYSPELVPGDSALGREHGLLARWLVEAGVDVVLVECMNTAREALVAAQAALELGAVVWVSFVCGDAPDALLSGESLRDAVRAADRAGVHAVGVNCVPAATMAESLRVVREATTRPVLGYANGGRVGADGRWEPDTNLRGRRFASLCRQWLETGAEILGGCCGTRPEHIGILRRVVDKLDTDA